MWRICLLSVCLLVAWVEGDEETKLVKTAQGAVRGYKDPEHGIYSFQGIPYATAPTGPHKFKAPLPPPVWLEPLDAKDQGIVCPQASLPIPGFEFNITQQENCLIANVLTPDTQENNLPVVVYVHGGAFQMGWGNLLMHKKFVSEHNVIIVSFNYRLGIHGFLCLGTEDAPGNAGMKDQVALLRWVKKNIANFGGNPADVTIAGYSAGSVSVDLLMLSKSAQGLFNKVIPESGVSLAVFSIQPDPLEVAQSFAKENNVNDLDNIYALEQFYKTATFDVLTKYSFMDRKASTMTFTPCVERVSTADAFLVESPVDILIKGTYKKVPVLHGFANMEGSLRLAFFDQWKDGMNEKFSDFLPADLKFESEEQKEEVANTVKHFYFGDKPLSNDSILAYIDYFSDVIFTYPTLREIKLMVENGHDQIYLYEYSFVDENTPVIPHADYKGAGHCAQSNALAEMMFEQSDHSKYTNEFKNMGSTLRTIWANFVKTGRPVPEGSDLPAWPVVGADWAPHMSLNRELNLRGPLLQRRAEFWESIYEKHYRQPVAPPTPPARKDEL